MSALDRFRLNVLAALERQGMSQSELARTLDMAQSNLSRMLSGKIDPSISNLERIAVALGGTLSSMLDQPGAVELKAPAATDSINDRLARIEEALGITTAPADHQPAPASARKERLKSLIADVLSEDELELVEVLLAHYLRKHADTLNKKIS
jgi:transcriptional regulator with XRE-family HTH domain